MALFPQDVNFSTFGNLTIDETETENTPLAMVGRSFVFDYDTGRFKLTDGEVEETDDIQAIKQWITLYILTDVLKYKIYDDQFGVSFKDLLSYRLPRGYQVSEIIRRITDGIVSYCPKVKNVYDWEFDNGHFRFTVELINGEEVVING